MTHIIIVECMPDAILIKALNITEILHSLGKSRVIKRVARSEQSLIGIMDEDPGKPSPKTFKKEFRLEKAYNKYKLIVMKHIYSSNRLILLSPRLEEWILEACRETFVKPESYGLPNDADSLHRIINTKTHEFSKLLNDIKERSNRIKKLAELLKN